jgi:16S rRNA (guanine966-N2)-methyltransferase
VRVIAGKYGRRNLRSPSSEQIRPTSDRLRETLFGVLYPRIEGTRFLDLCAGSGAVGIEALSRGAVHATFVDRSRKMFDLIQSNLHLCGVPAQDTYVVLSEATNFLDRIATHESYVWDIAFFDPPYAASYLPVLECFRTSAGLLSPGGLLIVEHHHKKELKDVVDGLRRVRLLRQGESCLSFYERE